MTTVMFIGMSFCLPLAYWQEASKAKEQQDVHEPLIGGKVSVTLAFNQRMF